MKAQHLSTGIYSGYIIQPSYSEYYLTNITTGLPITVYSQGYPLNNHRDSPSGSTHKAAALDPSEIIRKVWVLPKCESSYLTFRGKALRQREKTWEDRKTRNIYIYIYICENGHGTTNGQSEWKNENKYKWDGGSSLA